MLPEKALRGMSYKSEMQRVPWTSKVVWPAWPLARLGFVTLESFTGAGYNKHPWGWASTLLQPHLPTVPPTSNYPATPGLVLVPKCEDSLSGRHLPIFTPPPHYQLCLMICCSSSQAEAQLKCPFLWEAPPGLRGGTGPSFLCAASLHLNTF